MQLWRVPFLCLCLEAVKGINYTFYRNIRAREKNLSLSRRAFGGQPVNPLEYPGLVVLMDHLMSALCSGAVISRRWVITAAHCATPEVAYVLYNFKSKTKTDLAPVHLLYQHPEYRVVMSDDDNGMDVVLLHHDVGLIRTRTDMHLSPATRFDGKSNSYSNLEALEGMKNYKIDNIMNSEIQIFGYGQTQNSSQGSELRSVKLKVVTCERSAKAWQYCACGEGKARGVCAGDSGGPVMYKGQQVGVTSMGPMECSAVYLLREGEMLPQVALSVFTSLEPYVDVINDTIYETEDTVKMKLLKIPIYKEEENSAQRLQLFGVVFWGCYAWITLI